MKLIEIPENTNELRDYNKFIQTIIEVQKFNRNIGEFLEKTLTDEFFKPFKEWYNIASEEDKKQLNKLGFGENIISVDAFNYYRYNNDEESLNNLKKLWKEDKNKDKHESEKYKIKIENGAWEQKIFYCYKTNKFIVPNSNKMKGKSYFYNKMICKPNDDGLGMIVTFKTSYKEHAWPGWLPTYHIKLQYEINLLEKSIKKISDVQTETSNKNY